MESEILRDKILSVLEEKKGIDVTALPVADERALADYFIFATATSTTHMRALAEEVEFAAGSEPHHRERAGDWILIDYITCVVHIFLPDARQFYDVERLWRK